MQRYRTDTTGRNLLAPFDMFEHQRDKYKAAVSGDAKRSRVPRSVFDDPPPTRRLCRRTPLTESQRELAAQFLPLALSMAKPLKVSFPNDADEFESAACMAVVEAAQSYDETFNVRFSTFARYRIWGALRDVQRNLALNGHRNTLVAPTLHSLWPDAELHGEVLNTTCDLPVGSELESLELVEHELKNLPQRNAKVCRCIYLENKPLHLTGAALGCSKTRVFDIHKESLQLLNERWKGSPPEEFFLK